MFISIKMMMDILFVLRFDERLYLWLHNSFHLLDQRLFAAHYAHHIPNVFVHNHLDGWLQYLPQFACFAQLRKQILLDHLIQFAMQLHQLVVRNVLIISQLSHQIRKQTRRAILITLRRVLVLLHLRQSPNYNRTCLRRRLYTSTLRYAPTIQNTKE